MIKEQVDIKGLSVHFERNLVVNKGEASTKLQNNAAWWQTGVIPVIPVFVEIGFPVENL